MFLASCFFVVHRFTAEHHLFFRGPWKAPGQALQIQEINIYGPGDSFKQLIRIHRDQSLTDALVARRSGFQVAFITSSALPAQDSIAGLDLDL